MTAWIHSISLPAAGRTSRPTGEALPVQTSPPSAADDDARRLALAVERGDESAFQELYDRYHQRLFRLALVLGHGDENLAGETVQSVFLTAAAKLRRVESEEHLWNWLARVARQQLGKTRRQLGHPCGVIPLADLPECAEASESDSLIEEKLDAALLDLETQERQLIEWFYFDGLSHKEIAGQLGATTKAVSSRLERARARLRSNLNRIFRHES